MATSTRQLVVDYLLDHYGLGRRGTNDAEQSDTTTLSDDSLLGGHRGAEGIEPGCEVRARMDATPGGGGTVTYAEGRVLKGPTFSGGTITFDPPLTALGETPHPTNNDCTFSLLRVPFTFQGIHDAINQATTEDLFEKLELPITLVTDGDMLEAAVTSWTDSNATSSKSAASFPFAVRELFVNNSGANGYSHSGAIAVEPGKSYFLEATVRAVSGTAKLILYDETNSAAITLGDDDSTVTEPTILSNPSVTMPDGCNSVTVRPGCDEASADSYWSNVIFRRNDQREFTIADRAEIDRLGNLFVYSTQDWGTRGLSRTKLGHELEPRTAGLWVYRTYGSVGGLSLWYEEFHKPATLTSDTDTTSIPMEDVAAVAAAILLEPLQFSRWGPQYRKAAIRAEKAKRRYRKLHSVVNRSSRSVYQPVV